MVLDNLCHRRTPDFKQNIEEIMKISEITRKARESLANKWWREAKYTLGFIALYIASCIPSFIAILVLGENHPVVFSLDTMSGIAVIPLSFGMFYHYYQISRGLPSGFSDFFSGYKKPWDCIKFTLFTTLISAVFWFIPIVLVIWLPIVLVIWLGLIYDGILGLTLWLGIPCFFGLVYFIVLMPLMTNAGIRFITQDTSKGTIDAYKYVYRKMERRHYKKFLGLTCIAGLWILLGIISLGIGLLWAIPYCMSIFCTFYREYMEEPIEEPTSKQLDEESAN